MCASGHGREKNQRRSLRRGLGSLLVPADARRLGKKIGVLTEEDLLRMEKNSTGIRTRFDCSCDLRGRNSERVARFAGIFPPEPRRPLSSDADGTLRGRNNTFQLCL